VLEWKLSDQPGAHEVGVILGVGPSDKMSLGARATVSDCLSVEPLSLDLGDLLPGEARAATVDIRPIVGSEMRDCVRLEAEPGDDGIVQCTRVDSGINAVRWSIAVRCRAGAGYREHIVWVVTGNADQPRIRVAVVANHHDVYEVFPRSVLFGRDIGLVKWVTLRSNTPAGPLDLHPRIEAGPGVTIVTRREGAALGIGLARSTAAPANGRVAVFVDDMRAPLMIEYATVGGGE
jgi:hypothetical protein